MIEFEAKTDRELLILVAQQGNQAITELKRMNGTLDKHEKRITALETCRKFPLRINWQVLIIIATIAAGAVTAAGKAVGWW